MPHLYNTLIRTHHMTSRKKIASLRKAAGKSTSYALIRTGGVPGLMYAEGPDEAGVQRWVDHVQGLRYKDYRCLRRVGAVARTEVGEGKGRKGEVGDGGKEKGFEEVGSVGEFKEVMEKRGLLGWWREAMGYESRERVIGGSG